MSQVNMLSIDVSSTPDTIGAKGDSSFGQSNNSSAFADVMAQQQKQESGNNSRQNGKSSATTTQVNQAKLAVNKENSQNKAHLVNEEKPESSELIGDELVDESNNETQVEVQGWPDDPAGKKTGEKAGKETNENTSAKLTIADEQSNEISNVGSKKGLTAQELLALLTASDNTSTETQTKNGAISEKLVPVDDATRLPKVERVKASIAMVQQKINTSNSALDESQKTGEKSSDSNDTLHEKDKIKVSAEQTKLSLNGKAVEKVDIQAEPSAKNNLLKLSLNGEAVEKVDIQAKPSAKNNLLKLSLNGEAVDNRNIQTESSAKNNLPVNETQREESVLAKTEKAISQLSQDKEQSADVNSDLKQQKLTGSEKALATQINADERLNLAVSAANSQSINETHNNSEALVEGKAILKSATVSVAQPIKNIIENAQEILSVPVKNKPAERAVNAVLQQSMSVVSDNESNKQIHANNSATQSTSANSQQSMSQSFEQQTGEQQSKGKENQSTESDGKNISVNENKIELPKEVIAANTSDKSLSATLSATHNEDSSAVKPLTASQENAIQQLLSKNSADSITQQSIKNDIKLHDVTIAIHRKDFTNAVKEKVMVMINRKIKQLEIRLDPPELGSMQVKLNLQGEQAVVNFVVQNPQAREALEQNINKLKEMLADSGVDVGESNIEQQDNSSTEQDEFAKQQAGATNDALTGQNEDDFDQTGHNLYKASATGVDYYA